MPQVSLRTRLEGSSLTNWGCLPGGFDCGCMQDRPRLPCVLSEPLPATPRSAPHPRGHCNASSRDTWPPGIFSQRSPCSETGGQKETTRGFTLEPLPLALSTPAAEGPLWQHLLPAAPPFMVPASSVQLTPTGRFKHVGYGNISSPYCIFNPMKSSHFLHLLLSVPDHLLQPHITKSLYWVPL